MSSPNLMQELLISLSFVFALVNFSIADKKGRNAVSYFFWSLGLSFFATGIGAFLVFLLLLFLPKKKEKETEEQPNDKP